MGSGLVAKSCPAVRKPKHFGIGANGEDGAGKKSALDDRARNSLQGIARFGTQGGGAFESNETKQGEDQAQSQAAAGHAVQLELLPIEVQAVSRQNEHDDDQDHGDRNRLNPKHHASGDFDVAPGDSDGNCGDYKGEQRGGNCVARGLADQQHTVVIETADHAGPGGDIGEEQAPGRGCRKPGWQRHRGIGKK